MTEPDLQDDLDAYELSDEELALADREEPEPYVEPPPDADKANAMLRTLRGVQRELARIDRLADAEVARINAWREDRAHGLTRRSSAIEKALEQWMRAVNRLNPQRKSESLPNGKLALRAPGAGSLQIVDAAAFEKWWREERTAAIKFWLIERLAVEAKPEDTPDAWAAELLELVLTRSPLMRVKPEPNKTALKELDNGPESPSPDGNPDEALLPVIYGETDLDREVVPGVALLRSKVDTFKATV